MKKENEARVKYLKYSVKQGYHICYRKIKISANMGATNSGNPQCLAFLGFVFPYIPKECSLFFGYHRGDDYWQEHTAAQNAIKELSEIGERKVIANYPLMYMSKYEIIKKLRDRKIPKDCTWSCETPVKKDALFYLANNAILVSLYV